MFRATRGSFLTVAVICTSFIAAVDARQREQPIGDRGVVENRLRELGLTVVIPGKDMYKLAEGVIALFRYEGNELAWIEVFTFTNAKDPVASTAGVRPKGSPWLSGEEVQGLLQIVSRIKPLGALEAARIPRGWPDYPSFDDEYTQAIVTIVDRGVGTPIPDSYGHIDRLTVAYWMSPTTLGMVAVKRKDTTWLDDGHARRERTHYSIRMNSQDGTKYFVSAADFRKLAIKSTYSFQSLAGSGRARRFVPQKTSPN